MTRGEFLGDPNRPVPDFRVRLRGAAEASAPAAAAAAEA